MGASSLSVKALLTLPEASAVTNFSLPGDRLMVVLSDVTPPHLDGNMVVSEGNGKYSNSWSTDDTWAEKFATSQLGSLGSQIVMETLDPSQDASPYVNTDLVSPNAAQPYHSKGKRCKPSIIFHEGTQLLAQGKKKNSSEAAPAATEESDENPEAATEASSENFEEGNAGDQDAAEETPEIKLETAPVDFRFPTTNQTRCCFTRYVEYHRCTAAEGEGAPECENFAKYYRALCPGEWIDRWNENGTFPGPL
ncbi:Cytochrome c oxidase subunit 6b-1 [Morella rubra]|uniref:Cytochrome c oxidase subunit 6b-1 n=1 Tax=Morella rubra TaxID=262757 RepID=A0A6A1WET2_9ROSI|nr:Cytochrome c oxidase subunit 6b-1 [Morella rubra]